jgi:hypothetical protein
MLSLRALDLDALSGRTKPRVAREPEIVMLPEREDAIVQKRMQWFD